MPELLREWTPQAYGIWTLVLFALVYFVREWRETRKMSADDRLARRDGYAQQVSNLQGENRNLQRDLAELRREYDEYRRLCQDETDQLRAEVRQLVNELVGLKRRIDAQGSAALRLVEDERAKGERPLG